MAALVKGAVAGVHDAVHTLLNHGTALIKDARAGDNGAIQKLLNQGAHVDERSDGTTALLAAAKAGKAETVKFLLSKGANVEARDDDSYTIIKLALDNGHKDIAEWIVQNYPKLIVTDPRLPKGKTWITEQFELMSNNVKDKASKPDPKVLERIISGELGPIEGRSVSHVYWEHILLRYVGDIPKDIERNYSESLILSLVGTFERILKGHDGIKESARLLNSKLPTTQYDIIGTVVETQGNWVTERWGYHDGKFQVTDGIDSFLIEKAKIQVKMINYNVEKAEASSVYRSKMGLAEK